jgi:hypothetical protein
MKNDTPEFQWVFELVAKTLLNPPSTQENWKSSQATWTGSWNHPRWTPPDSEGGSPSEGDQEDREDDRERHRKLKTFKIPKRSKNKIWNAEQLDNFRKNWPHLKNFTDSVFENATLSELTAMGKQKVLGSRLLSHVLSANFEQLKNFPTRVEKGLDDCTGLAHSSRFLRGYVGDSKSCGNRLDQSGVQKESTLWRITRSVPLE